MELLQIPSLFRRWVAPTLSAGAFLCGISLGTDRLAASAPGLIVPSGYDAPDQETDAESRDSFQPERGLPRAKAVAPAASAEPTAAAPSPPSVIEATQGLENLVSQDLISVDRVFPSSAAAEAEEPVFVPLSPLAAGSGGTPEAGERRESDDARPKGFGPGFISADEESKTIYFFPSTNGVERHWLPSGLLYKSYLAGEKEPRFALRTLYESGRGMIWEAALGGRVGIYRWGPLGTNQPNGWQLDIEGASLVRLDLEESQDVDAVDFRFGIPVTYRRGPWSYKTGYYHISSHLGDEFMLKHPDFVRINYVRDSFLLGVSYDVNADVRTYGEVAYALQVAGGAEPLEFQFGAEYSPGRPGGAPFAAMNIHLREEFDFGGSVNIEAGWQWRGEDSRHLFRVGGQYFNGKSMQYSFFNRSEQLTGLGIWFDY